MPKTVNRILIMAGGTGGHIFPGLAVAKELASVGWDVHWLGTESRMEADIVPAHGYPIHFIKVSGVRGNGLGRLLLAPFKVLKALSDALRIMRTLKPSVVLGMGGFASGPGGIAAKLTRTPLVIHEQNAVAGWTNKSLSRVACKVFSGFEHTRGLINATWLGNPVRSEITDIKPHSALHSPLRILVIGGSLGAKALNDYVPKSMKSFTNIHIRHQCGKHNQEQVLNAYSVLSGIRVEVTEFIDDIAGAYTWADVVICRAGALTVAEISASAKTAIFVPFPHAVDDHQTLNAKSLSEHEAAVLLPQVELEHGALENILAQIQQEPDTFLLMGQKARALFKRDAAQLMAAHCQSLSSEAAL